MKDSIYGCPDRWLTRGAWIVLAAVGLLGQAARAQTESAERLAAPAVLLAESQPTVPGAAIESPEVYSSSLPEEDANTAAAANTSVDGVSSLPEAPSSLVAVSAGAPQIQKPLRAAVPPQDPTSAQPPVAPLRWKYIPAGYAYQHLSAGDKVYIGFRDLYSPGNIADIFLAAGWSHVRNGAPDWGSDRGAFGQRLGSAAINETAEGIFDDAFFAVLFKEDPRYFVEGPNHDPLHRSFHAVSRVLWTRNDNGSHGPNFALLASFATVHALDTAFYPKADRSFDAASSGFEGSLIGAAMGYMVDEFLQDALVAAHLKHKP